MAEDRGVTMMEFLGVMGVFQFLIMVMLLDSIKIFKNCTPREKVKKKKKLKILNQFER